jgi:hypothetical protein
MKTFRLDYPHRDDEKFSPSFFGTLHHFNQTREFVHDAPSQQKC